MDRGAGVLLELAASKEQGETYTWQKCTGHAEAVGLGCCHCLAW